MKKEVKKEHWPRLLKNSGKYNWLKADWSKWVDEDEEDAKPDFDGLGKYPRKYSFRTIELHLACKFAPGTCYLLLLD